MVLRRAFATLPPSRPSMVKGIPHLRPQKETFTGAKHIIAVGSGKGGVGKSTVSVNLAVGLANLGYRVGLLDADIFGPSIPTMMRISQRPLVSESKKLIPLSSHNVRCMSIGLLTNPDSALVWRGLMVQKALNQLIHATEWDEDVLIIDLPPGTGDVQLSIAQQLPLAYAIIVTTPQDVSLIDAIKGADMFRAVGAPLLGVVENMSQFVCPSCNTTSDIFGTDGGERMASKLGVPLLASIPIHIDICKSGDRGSPILVSAPEHPVSKIYQDLCREVEQRMNLMDKKV